MQDNLTALGNRLAEYRRGANPHHYNVNVYGMRRTPGLRREEVAKGTGLSVEVISKIERGKYPSVNARLLHDLSDFYRLDDAKRDDLFHLANVEERRVEVEIVHSIPPALQEFVDHQREYPTFVINRRWDVIGWNDALNIVFGDMASMPADRRNILWIVFGIPELSNLLIDWERHARRIAGQFRLDFDWSRGDPRFVALVEELSAASEAFAALWTGPLDIRFKETVLKQIRHPQLGLLEFEQMGFRFTADPDMLVGVHYPCNDETARKMRGALSTRVVVGARHTATHGYAVNGVSSLARMDNRGG